MPKTIRNRKTDGAWGGSLPKKIYRSPSTNQSAELSERVPGFSVLQVRAYSPRPNTADQLVLIKGKSIDNVGVMMSWQRRATGKLVSIVRAWMGHIHLRGKWRSRTPPPPPPNLVIGSKTSRDLRSVRTSCKPFWPYTHVRSPLQLTLRCRFHFLRFFLFEK